MVQRHSLESKPSGCKVKAMQKLLSEFSSQKRLHSVAQEPQQVIYDFLSSLLLRLTLPCTLPPIATPP
jgi:hypothetical protein